MKDVVVPKNTHGSNMDEPLWFDPDERRDPNNTPEENARIDALLKKLDDICKNWKVDRTPQDKKD